MTRATPVFRELRPDECEALLARAVVGRLAISFHDRVEVFPIHYAYRDGWIVWRTSPGAKVRTIEHNRWVAFEVDEIEGPYDWRSVVAHGAAYPLEEASAPEARARALELLRVVDDAIGTADDPAPWRGEVYHMRVDRMSGRAASTREEPRLAASG